MSSSGTKWGSSSLGSSSMGSSSMLLAPLSAIATRKLPCLMLYRLTASVSARTRPENSSLCAGSAKMLL